MYRELSAFDARGAGRLQSQLLLVYLFDPLRQIRHPIQNAADGPSLDQQVDDGYKIIVHPSPGSHIATDVIGDHFQSISKSFQIYFFGNCLYKAVYN